MNENIVPNRSNAATPEAAAQSFSFGMIVSALRCWWKIAMPVGLLLAAAAAALVYYITEPLYTAETWLIIRDRSTMPLQGVVEDPKKFIANQLEMIKSPPIIDPVSVIVTASTPELIEEFDPVAALKRLIKVLPKGQSEYFVVQFTSKRPESAAQICNEVADSYIRLQERTEGSLTGEQIKLLERELANLDIEVEQSYQEWYAKYKEVLGIAPNEVPAPVTGPAITHEQQQQNMLLQAIDTQLVQAEVDLIRLRTSISALEKQPLAEPMPWQVEQVAGSDPKVASLQSQIDEIDPRIDEHKRRSVNVAANKTLQVLEQQRARLAAELKTAQDSALTKGKAELQNALKAQRDGELVALRDKQANAVLLVDMLKQRMDNQEKVEGVAQNQQRDAKEKLATVERLKRANLRAEDRYDLLKKSMDDLAMQARAPGRVEIYQRARVPQYPDETIPYKKILMASLVAFCVPFGLAVGFEHLFRRVSSREQLEQGQIDVVGEVTTLPRSIRHVGGEGQVDREVQLFEESIDGLRTHLTLVQSLQGMRVLAVASSVSREGKTSLASQLAVSLASATGERTLLIDGDTRSPDIHRIFDVDQGPGLVEVLEGGIGLEEAIETGFSDRLHLLTAGRLSTSPHKLLGGGEFPKLVEKLKGMYRYVIIDTPPILPACEALVMARAADATVLCVRRDYSRVDQVKEAYARLRSAGVKTAGAVLNGIPTRAYSHRYGSYYYTRSRFDRPLSNDPEARAQV